MLKSEDSFLPELRTKEDVISFFQEATLVQAEFWTGILGSDIPQYKLSAGKLVQSVIKGRLLTQLSREIKKYREKGQIKEDFFATNKNQVTFLELLKYVDVEIPDEEVFKAAKSIFFTTVEVDSDSIREEIGHQLLLICKQLSSLDLIILKTCYQATTTDGSGAKALTDFNHWCRFLAEKTGYNIPELFSTRDEKLVALGLLSVRHHSDFSGINKVNARLTNLGMTFCEYIIKWQN